MTTSVGRLRYLDLGFFADHAPAASEWILTSSVLAPLTRLRSSQTDKRTFGHILVVGGSRSYPGAVMLATRAALRSGAGFGDCLCPGHACAGSTRRRIPRRCGSDVRRRRRGGLAAGTLELIRERLPRPRRC
ncbi:MAG: hypothetical protein WDM96_02330 [Lacunisphaera sp.]